MPKPKQPVDQTVPYRVRDRYVEGEPLKVWGSDLDYDTALKLKERVVASKQSRTARLEPMSVPLPVEATATATATRDLSHDVFSDDHSASGVKTVFSIEGFDPIGAPADGVVVKVPLGGELLVNGQVVAVPASVQAGDHLQCRALDPALAAARERALAAARPVVQARNAGRAAYKDRTVKQPQPRQGPAPRDKTVSRQPVHVRLDQPIVGVAKPLASPLKVATMPIGEQLPDDVPYEDDLHDLAANIGGAESDDDVAHAKRVRDQRG